MSKIDILYLQWPKIDRDFNIVLPSLIYLKKKHKINYFVGNIWLGYFFILKYKPKIIIFPSSQGAKVNIELIKSIKKMNIKVITFISEGNVKEDAVEQFLWGWNKDKILYQDKMLLWSKRSENIFLHKHPELSNKLVTVGGTGFDRYKLIEFESKSEFLNEHNFKYQKVIGIAAWGFDHMFGNYYKENEKYYLKTFGQEQIDMHRNDLYKLQKIYKKLIENNKDILFVLRYHPMTIDFEKNEFYNLDKNNNVFISNKYKNNKYSISDLINISDLWIGYETTTALEAWLLGKSTFLINPTKDDFIRENVYKGSPVVKNYDESRVIINEYFTTGAIKSFEKLESNRLKIIKDVIEYEDGKNYIRAANEIIKIYNKPDRKIKYGLMIYLKVIKQLIRVFLSKTILQNRWDYLELKDIYNGKDYITIYENVIDV